MLFLKKIVAFALALVFSVLATVGAEAEEVVRTAKKFELKPLFLLDTSKTLFKNMERALRKCRRVEGKNNFHLVITGHAQVMEKSRYNALAKVHNILGVPHPFYDNKVRVLWYKNRLICSSKPLVNFRIDRLAQMEAMKEGAKAIALTPNPFYRRYKVEKLKETLWKAGAFCSFIFDLRYPKAKGTKHFIMLLVWNGDNDGTGGGWIIRSIGCANVPFSLPTRPLYAKEKGRGS